MRLTRRGLGVLVVVAVAAGLAAVAGPRALNAVAAPLLAALIAGVALVVRARSPTVAYGPIRSGHAGDERSLRVDVEGGGLVAVGVSLPAGLEGADVDAVLSPPATIERDVRLGARGVYRLEPPRVSQRDPLGLVERRIDADATREFVVYPPIRPLAEPSLSTLFVEEATDRGEFDRLREYVPGDPLRNVHWKTSARRDDFYVVEYAPTRRSGSVTVAADATEGHADAMAVAAATLAVGALDIGFEVALVVPRDDLPADRGGRHREDLLRLLADTGPGSVPARTHDAADVSIRADAEGTRVRVADREYSFESLVGSEMPDRTREVAP